VAECVKVRWHQMMCFLEIRLHSYSFWFHQTDILFWCAYLLSSLLSFAWCWCACACACACVFSPSHHLSPLGFFLDLVGKRSQSKCCDSN
jgi:hypothetical protein